MITKNSLRTLVLSLVLLSGGAAMALAQSMSPSTSLNGTIASFTNGSITLTLADNSTRMVTIDPKTLVLARQPASLADIIPGEALGVAARRLSDGTLAATSVNVFSPELWAGAQKGQWPMTNGQVMTNATVANVVTSMQDRVITMIYQGVLANISLLDDTQVHRIVTVQPSALAVGQRVAIRGTANANGDVLASSVSFDQTGD